MSAIAMLVSVPSFEGGVTAEKLTQLSELYETKAAFLALLEDPKDVKVVVRRVQSAGIKPGTYRALAGAHDSLGDEAPGMYGPSQHRRLGARWAEEAARVNEALQAATGYELTELTTVKVIESCMALTGPTAHPALYPALMKLYRLQIEIEKGE